MHLLRVAVCGLVAVGAAAAQQQGAAAAALLDRYCIDCHRGPFAEKDLDLDVVFATDAPVAVRARSVAAMQRVRSRTMPPADEPQPSADERRELLLAFADRAPAEIGTGEVTMRRLARREYAHTVQDLCGVAVDASLLLPDDPRAYGFDNQGDVMTVSPMLFEQYFAAAQTIATAMLADPAATARAFAVDQPLAATLGPFLTRAFRRPVTAAELDERIALHDDVLAAGLGIDAARTAVLQSVLASPVFLFRVEVGCKDDASRLAPHELAVRLSYLVTASMPDAELQAAADDGTLADPAVLAAQARRLAIATGGRPLADGFGAQWLHFADVLTANADFRRYPEIWNGNLRPALYEEAAQFFAALVRDDASVLQLLDADHTWLDEGLAKHYGIAGVTGPRFVRVNLPDRRRGGVLAMGAVLMATSFPLRTSPVLRGRWILDSLLDAPPPPPPANAGTLPKDDVKLDGVTLRERLLAHRRSPSCANCHAQMDALGFALENFDVLGRWRSAVEDKPIDSTAVLPDGTELDGVVALKDELLRQRRDFARAMTARMLVYAIGRQLRPADERELQRLVDVVAAGEYRFSALLGAVVTSPLFVRRETASSGGER